MYENSENAFFPLLFPAGYSQEGYMYVCMYVYATCGTCIPQVQWRDGFDECYMSSGI